MTQLILDLQQFGVIPFEIRTLKKPHTEKRRIRTIVYYKAICWHRGTVGAWRNRGYLRVLLILWSTSLQSCGLQDFLKTFIPKYLARICTLHLRRSLCRRHLRDIVHYLRLSVTPCAYYVRLLVYHSIFRKNHKVCHLCLEFEVMSHGGTERTEDY